MATITLFLSAAIAMIVFFSLLIFVGLVISGIMRERYEDKRIS
jgi:hypothetical protein